MVVRSAGVKVVYMAGETLPGDGLYFGDGDGVVDGQCRAACRRVSHEGNKRFKDFFLTFVEEIEQILLSCRRSQSDIYLTVCGRRRMRSDINTSSEGDTRRGRGRRRRAGDRLRQCKVGNIRWGPRNLHRDLGNFVSYLDGLNLDVRHI